MPNKHTISKSGLPGHLHQDSTEQAKLLQRRAEELCYKGLTLEEKSRALRKSAGTRAFRSLPIKGAR